MLGRVMSFVAAFACGVAAQTAEISKADASSPLAVFDAPDVEGVFAVAGEYRADGVPAGSGAYLELRVFYGDQYYFSKQTRRDGSVGGLETVEDWQTFALMFNPSAGGAPDRLELHATLPAGGSVHIREVEVRTGAAAFARPGAWWSHRQAGWVGGAMGGVFGVIGCVIGLLAWRRADRRIVFGTLAAWIGLSAIGLVAGLVALVIGQPYAVYYPLLLLGGIGTGVPAWYWFVYSKRYEADELRRVSALDAA